MKIIKNVLISVLNNIQDANSRKVMVVKNIQDAEDLLTAAKNSKLNPLSGSGSIPFVAFNSKHNMDFIIDENSIIGFYSNIKVISGPVETGGVLYIFADIVIDDAYYMLLKQSLSVSEEGFYFSGSETVGFGLKGMVSNIGQNLDEVLQIITFDFIIGYVPETVAPVIQEDSAATVNIEEQEARPSVEPAKPTKASKTTRTTSKAKATADKKDAAK